MPAGRCVAVARDVVALEQQLLLDRGRAYYRVVPRC